MPNFTFDIKRDILSEFPKSACCGGAMLAALICTSGSIYSDRIEFVSENEKIAGYFLHLFESFYGVRPEVKSAVLDKKRKKDKLTFSYGGEQLERVKKNFASISERLENECCILSYIKGAFLGGGSCTLPKSGAKTGYHLEFIFPTGRDAELFSEMLLKIDLLPRVLYRGEKGVVYLKSGDAISDFLSLIGAHGALERLETVLSARAESNNENRLANCYAGNADKVAIASASQILNLEKIKDVLPTLPQVLQDAARARLDYPTYSLTELAGVLGISKSCLNHRMRKLTKIYFTMEEKDD